MAQVAPYNCPGDVVPAQAFIESMRELVPAWNPEMEVELVTELSDDVAPVCTVTLDVTVVVAVIVAVKFWPAPLGHVEGQYFALKVFPLEVRTLT